MGLVPVGRMNMMCGESSINFGEYLCVCVCVCVCVLHTEECARGAQKLAGLVCQGTREE